MGQNMSDESDYELARERQSVCRLDDDIDEFLKHYRDNEAVPASERRLLILFPGGLGSALPRARERFTGDVNQTFSFEDYWITPKLFFGDEIAHAEMRGELDHESKFIVPDGTVGFCGITPYNRFVEWCRRKHLDVFIFGYDWRRRANHSVRFFLDTFLPYLLKSISDAGLTAPSDITLLGHSLGGMIVKLIAHDPRLPFGQIRRFITVGTPFYGYAGHTRRYFEGEPFFFLNKKSEVARIIATLRGGYYLQFLDAETYKRNKRLLAADPEFPLKSYPSLDADMKGQPADPFDTTVKRGQYRYPRYVDLTEVAHAKGESQGIAADLPATIVAKFYNLRGVQVSGGKAQNGTNITQTWARVPDSFDPDEDELPITFCAGAGDGATPAWAGWLASLRSQQPGNVVTFKGDLQHMLLLEYPEIQDSIFRLLHPDVYPVPIAPVDVQISTAIPVASPAETQAFVQRMRETGGPEAARADFLKLPLERRVPLIYGVFTALVRGFGPATG